MVEQPICNRQVAGSSPVSGTIRLAKSEPLPILPSMGFGISHGGSSKVSRVHISLIYIIWQGYCCTSKKIWPTFECSVKTTGSSRSATYLQGRWKLLQQGASPVPATPFTVLRVVPALARFLSRCNSVVECLVWDQDVAGSNPVISTMIFERSI